MRTRSISISLVLIVALCFLKCASAFAQTASPYLITGRVVDESNQGVDKVRVCAKPEDYAQMPMVPCGLSDVNGNFVIHAGRAAHFTIFPEKTAAGYQWQAVPFYRNPSMPVVQVVLNESNQTASVSVTLGPKNGALVGKAVDASTGRPIENIRFTLCQAAAPRVCFITSVKNTAGEFDIGAALIPFTLKISADGYDDWWGFSGVDKNIPISVASAAKIELVCLMKRKSEVADRPMSEAEKLSSVNLPAPIQLSPADGAELSPPADQIALKNYSPNTKVEWQAVPGAASYTVELDFCDGRDKNIRQCIDPQPLTLRMSPPPTGIVGTSYEFTFVARQPGRWRVWAIDKKGEEGFKSPWRTFFYIH
jgi:hypothetical protein